MTGTSLSLLGLGGVTLLAATIMARPVRAADNPAASVPSSPVFPVAVPTPASAPAIQPVVIPEVEAPPATVDPSAPASSTPQPMMAVHSIRTLHIADKNHPDSGNSALTFEGTHRKSSGERLLGPLGRDLEVTGNMTLHGQSNAVTGGSIATQTYRDQNVSSQDYRNLGPFQNNMDLTINGKIFSLWRINARLSNSRYGSRFDQAFGFNFKNKGTSVDLGTVTPHLAGNELVSLSRSVQGIMYSRDLSPRVTASALFSLTKSTTRRGSFQGQGTSGPYYLNATQLIEGSEKVQLNGRDLEAGKDYRVDYYVGQISFLGGLIINQTDTVTFSYEAQSYNTTPGILTGTRWSYTGTTGNAYGLTYITQKASGAKTHNGNVVEPFAIVGLGGTSGGVSDPQWKYYLSSLIDSAFPFVLRYGSRNLVEGVDYYLNRDLRYFQLKTTLPADTALTATASLQAEYRPVRQNAVSGDRTVIGLDSTMHVAKNGTVSMTFGSSQAAAASSSSGTGTGTGMNLTTNWQFAQAGGKNALGVTLGYKDIGQNFSSIDSTSSASLQAQKGVNANFSFAPNRFYNITTSLTQSKVANQYTSSTYGTTTTTGTTTAAAPVIWATNQAMNTALNIQLPNLPSLQLSHGQTVQSSSSTIGSKSSYSSDQLNLSWTRGFATFTTGFSRNATHGQSVFSNSYVSSVTTVDGGTTGTPLDQVRNGTYTTTNSNSTSDASRFSLRLNPAQWFNISGDLGFSRNSSDGGAASNARDSGINLALLPLPGMSVTLGLTDTSNGQSTSSYYNTTATTSTTNGSQLGTNINSGQRTRATNASLQYAPWRVLSFGITTSKSLSLVPGYDNSENNATDFLMDLTPWQKLHLTFNTSLQKVTYVGGQGDSNNQTNSLSGTIGPFGRLSFSTTVLRLNFKSATYSTASNGTRAAMAASRASAFGGGDIGTGLNTVTTGYLQNGVSNSISLRTDYNVGQNRSLYLRWQNLDQSAPTQTVSSTGTTTGTTSSGTYHSSNNFRQGVASVGFDVRFTEVVGFTLGYNLLTLKDRDDTRYSYKAHSITADLSARF